jgi:FKBP-type peptidyl-prolyl cis-trans isomerase
MERPAPSRVVPLSQMILVPFRRETEFGLQPFRSPFGGVYLFPKCAHHSIDRGTGVFHAARMKQFSRLLAGAALSVGVMGGALSVSAAALKDGLYAEFDTSKGKILVRLEYEKVPLTVANFVGLAEGTKNYAKDGGTPAKVGKPFYDGLNFHRVIADFMIQGGCPQGTGRGGPGYRFPDEIDRSLKHDGPGKLSMANAGPDTNGSQFFITHKETPWLDGKHSVFGSVVTGQDVVNKIARGDKLNKLTIKRVGKQAEAFKGGEAHFQDLLGSLKEREQAAMAKAAAAAQNQVAGLIADLEKEHGTNVITTPSGLQYLLTKAGTGEKVGKGKKIKAHYEGKLTNGRMFDSSIRRGQPLEFTVGVGQVIPGWDEALSDMKKGEKRVLIIPSKLAYGERGAGGVIPPNATLIFDVELVDF